MSNTGSVLPFTGVMRVRSGPPAPKLPSRSDPCPLLVVSRFQDNQLETLSQTVAAVVRAMATTLPHDQVEEQVQNAVDVGFARAMRCGNE